MTVAALSRGDVSRFSVELRRLRDSLRPASLSTDFCLAPFENVWDVDDRLLYLSRNVEEHVGWSWDYLMRSQPGLSLFRPGDADRIYPHFFRAFMGQAARGVDYSMRHADGTGYVWLTDDMFPGRRGPDGRVREVRIRSYNVTAIRARELEFLIDCLRMFDPRRDAAALEELGVPALLASVIPGLAPRRAAQVVPFRLLDASSRTPPGLEPAFSGGFSNPPRR